MARAPATLIDGILRRQVVIVAGKGGVGKSTVAAALARQAALRGGTVLAVDVAADGALERMFGERRTPSFEPRQVEPGLWVAALLREDALHEYLATYFHVPKIVRHTPVGKVVEFIATSVPGAKDILILGKILHEAQRTTSAGHPVWDTIVIDGMATGHMVAQLRAPFEVVHLVKGGLVTSQASTMVDVLQDHARTTVVPVALPEESPLVEAREIVDAARTLGIHASPALINKVFMPVDPYGFFPRLAKEADRSHDGLAAFLSMPPSLLDSILQLAKEIRSLEFEYLEMARSLLGKVGVLPLLGTRGGTPTASLLGRQIAQLLVSEIKP